MEGNVEVEGGTYVGATTRTCRTRGIRYVGSLNERVSNRERFFYAGDLENLIGQLVKMLTKR